MPDYQPSRIIGRYVKGIFAVFYEVQSKSNAYIFIVTVQELLLQPR